MLSSCDAFGKTVICNHWENRYILNKLVILGKEAMNSMLYSQDATVYT